MYAFVHMCVHVHALVCRHSGKNHLPGYMRAYIHVYVCVCARARVQVWWEGPFTWIHTCIHVYVCACV